MEHNKRSSFSGKLGYVLSAAGASVGLGNIWRFPYLAAKYGGGIFLLIYILLALTFGYTMIVAETAIGRMTKKSPVGAFSSFGKSKWLSAGGWINAIIPVLIVPYYSVIGGWVIKYLVEYVKGNGQKLAADGYFSDFISNGTSTEICFAVFALFTLAIIYAGVRNGIERVSKFMMPILIVLSVIIAVYSVTRPGALEGVKYFLTVPNVKKFFLDDGGCGDGTDVLFPCRLLWEFDHVWILYEKDVSIEDSTKCRSIRYSHRNYGGSDDHPGSICLFRRRSGYAAGRACTDVYYDSESVCKHGIWNSSGNFILRTRVICSDHKLDCTDRECSVYL